MSWGAASAGLARDELAARRAENYTQCWVHEVMPEVLQQSDHSRVTRSRWIDTSITVRHGAGPLVGRPSVRHVPCVV